MSDTIQDQLRGTADRIEKDPGSAKVSESADLMRRAAGTIRAIEESHESIVSATNARAQSEWITLPWGGSLRKSEVSGVDERIDGAGRTHVQVWRGDATHDSPASDVNTKAWLADIERQLGIVR